MEKVRDRKKNYWENRFKELNNNTSTFHCISRFCRYITSNWLGKYNLSSVEDVEGNLVGYVVLMVIIWIFAAFGEEFLFRGYYMKALAELLGNNNKDWVLSAIITSLLKTYASTPILRIIAATSFNLSSDLATSIKFAPRLANSLEIDNPIPEDAPVTKIVLSLNVVLFN